MASGMLGVVMSRPRLSTATIVGAVVSMGVHLAEPQLRPSTAFTAGWNAFCLVFLLSMTWAIRGTGPDHIRARAAREDEGRHLILGLVLAASVASLIAIAGELSLAKQSHGVVQAAHVAAAFWTVTASWLTVQAIFALHYAHEYYTARGKGRQDAGGLAFPGGEAPDYWDFLHFSIVIGVAAQTADIAITAKGLRRLATLHSLVAFAFNTVVVALTINLLAGLF
ncbi:MAG: DUF1345 domain-containing protein [Phenylobacterium zucineum]|nr:MAG: DUF1345 domain-containing protein [Phenylobacterium zucineum]